LSPDPSNREAILRARLDRARRKLDALRRVEGRFPWIRLGALGLALLGAYLAFQLLPPLWAWPAALLALAGFVFAAARHSRVIERAARVEAFCNLLETHLARLALDWEGIPPPAPLSAPPGHPFAADLDVTGPRSLHQLLDTAAALGGSRRLADWLLAPIPDPQAAARRQALVRELAGRPALRACLELDGRLANPNPAGRWDTAGILDWLERRAHTGSFRPLLDVLALLALANVLLFVLNAVGLLPPVWMASMAVYLGLQSLRFRESSEVFDEAYNLARQLGRLRGVLAGIETIPLAPGSALASVCAPLRAPRQRPSAALRRIRWIVSAASLRNNPFLGLLLNLLAPWDLFFAYQLERFKLSLRGVLPAWLNAWHELEALASLANYAVLHPEAAFPIFRDPGSRPIFTAEAIGHPLIPAAARVNNDFRLEQLGEVVIITGSNMSGKSTFLRTLGANLVLAFAGCPVPAGRLETIPFRVFTSMTLSDSLSDGISFFYAEVRRLKALLDQLEASHPYPLFFLIDEIFRGTNNRERRQGSRAYTGALVDRNGVGFISTHDLELAHLSETSPTIRNFHFREDIRGGKMVFDYTIRSGPSPTTNALRIMAMAGLPVQTGQKTDRPA
jgi:hypothetical protein